MNANLTYLKSRIADELARLDWDCTSVSPTRYGVYVDDDLPLGWVRISDDYATLVVGPAASVLEALQSLPDDAEYGELGEAGKHLSDKPPTSSYDWPDDLLSVEPLEEVTILNEINTLITVATNGGIRYAAGPHGASCALSDWMMNFGNLAKTREDAITTGCE